MLSQFIKNAGVQLIELSRKTGLNNGYISKVVRGYTYKSREAYDIIYDAMEAKNSRAPRKDNVSMYPTSKAKGSWDIWIDGKYAATLCFKSSRDICDFLDEKDNRLELIKSMMIEETSFDNLVRTY